MSSSSPTSPTDPVAMDLATLREAWRMHSLAGNWTAADDWHTPAVDALTNCLLAHGLPAHGLPAHGLPAHGLPAHGLVAHGLVAHGLVAHGLVASAGPDLVRACVRLGRSRAEAGIGIAETIEDLAALFTVLEAGDPPLRLVSSVAEGWAEEGLARHSLGRCEDPLTGLATMPYLRTRLAEVYREAGQLGTSPACTHRLVVVRLSERPDPWRRMSQAILLGHDLRAAFPGGDTLSSASLSRPGSGPAIALVRARGDLPARYARLRRTIRLAFGAQIRMTPLPALLTEALRAVDKLAH